MFQRHEQFLVGLLQPGPPSASPIPFQSVGMDSLERAVSRTAAASTGSVTSPRGSASAAPAGPGTAVTLVRTAPSANPSF